MRIYFLLRVQNYRFEIASKIHIYSWLPFLMFSGLFVLSLTRSLRKVTEKRY